jgi:hypothetical protein
MSDRYPRIRIFKRLSEPRDPPLVGIRECLDITFYMKRVHLEVVHDVLRALELYRAAVKTDALGWYADPYSGDWDEFDSKGQAYIHREMVERLGTSIYLSELPNSETGYGFIYEGNLFEAHEARVTSAVSFLLPTEELEARGPEWVRALALELAALLPFDSGHAGLCFLYPEDVVGYTNAIRDLALRYPGLDIPERRGRAYSLGTRLDGVHWLNFLGPPVLNALRGSDALRARLHTPGTTVQDLEGGRALVTLGPWPEAGDLEQGRDLPDHRELARLLEPWLLLERGGWSGFSHEDMRRWERRFL